jgi:hypothetical protein
MFRSTHPIPNRLQFMLGLGSPLLLTEKACCRCCPDQRANVCLDDPLLCISRECEDDLNRRSARQLAYLNLHFGFNRQAERCCH